MKVKVSIGLNGEFLFTPDDPKTITASQAAQMYSDVHKSWGERLLKKNDTEEHSLYAYNIIEPLDTVVEFEDWTSVFFAEQGEDFNNPTLFADDDLYTAIAWTLSPDGGPIMLRPGTPVYSGISPQRYQTGLNFQVDQLRRYGWDIQGRKIREAGNELARKRSAARYALLNAAVTGVAGHATNVSGGLLTYAAIRNLVQNNATSLFKPRVIVMNTGRAWDMGSWVTPGTTPMFDLQTQTGESVLLRDGYLTSLFNLNFYLFDTVPYDEIWFADAVRQDYDFIYMPLESAVENHPLDRTVDYQWVEDRTSYVRTGQRYWKFTIIA